MNNGSSLFTRSEAKANAATTARASGRQTVDDRIAYAAQPTATSHMTAVPIDSRHTGCHSMMLARDRRTVSATKVHTPHPYGLSSVARTHATGIPSEIHNDDRPFVPATNSTNDHSS